MSDIRLVDSHCHLDFPDFSDDLEDILFRAKQAGINQMVTICTRVTTFDRVLEIANRYDNIYCSVGVHPHNCNTEPRVNTDELIKLASNRKVIGLGESGLDFHRSNSSKDIQKSQFLEHIRASQETGLPLIVHTRDADEEMAKILKDEIRKSSFSGILHCFSSSRKLATTALDLGFYISISGIVTFKNAIELREIVQEIPLEKLLVETDSPYLAPVPLRGRRNEPSFTIYTAKKISEIKKISLEEVASATTNNFFELFTKART